ncbi:CdaR family transcriptional regulator [Clostridium sp. HV4-5-A1G]|uniref:CdaR family transcriptional regulator n=1 Tax=Clostridium sp. HV4-5-A1G TaxID=2004595 RepID=UPI00123C5D0D|nr:sugar diacid recognition domain-containing protein [Clostridium sp. HV4-5-A1G]KAA8667203.1 hypothetical protein F3O63_16160 [Clostridium sp. HV4-5-A1G]
MLNSEFAQNFISKIHKQLNVNVNIMNEKGIIIASSNVERIGNFHMCAYKIIHEKLSIMITEKTSDDLIGVTSPGVNLPLLDGIEPIGVVGVSGDPEKVMSLAKMIKFALESLFEYENKYYFTLHNQHENSKFVQALLFDYPQNPSRILKIARRMGFKDNFLRIPIFLCFSGDYAKKLTNHISDIYQKISYYCRQDILLSIDAQHILLFKALKHNEVSFYKAYVKDYIRELENNLNVKPQIKYICGICQTSFLKYDKIYKYMSWLKNDKRYSNKKLTFLQDYFLEYLLESYSIENFSPFFEKYCTLITKNLDINRFLDTVSALIDNNMKPKLAAESLYIHRNTIVARLNKIKKLLGINPINNVNDAIFLISIYEYLKHQI